MYFFQFADCCLSSYNLGLWKSTMFFHVLTVPYSYLPIWFPYVSLEEPFERRGSCGKMWEENGRNIGRCKVVT